MQIRGRTCAKFKNISTKTSSSRRVLITVLITTHRKFQAPSQLEIQDCDPFSSNYRVLINQYTQEWAGVPGFVGIPGPVPQISGTGTQSHGTVETGTKICGTVSVLKSRHLGTRIPFSLGVSGFNLMHLNCPVPSLAHSSVSLKPLPRHSQVKVKVVSSYKFEFSRVRVFVSFYQQQLFTRMSLVVRIFTMSALPFV